MNLFLVGYYGYDNLGDEILLSGLLSLIRKDRSMNCKVLTYSAEKTEKAHNVKAISRSKNLSLLKHIYKSDAVVVGGGSILQDVTTSRSLYYYLSILFFAKFLRKKVYMIGNGIGPIKKSLNQKLVSLLIPKVDGIIARDKASYQEFIKYGAKRIENGVDLAYNLNFDKYVASDVGNSDQKSVLLSLRPWKNLDKTFQTIHKTIEYLNSLGYMVYLLPMKHPEDTEICKKIMASFDNANLDIIENNHESVINHISGAKFLIGMRLHSLIISAIMNKPFIGISYDPKVDSFVSQVLDKDALNTEEITFESLKTEIDDLIENYDKVKQTICQSTLKNKVIAEKEVNLFKKWVLE